MNVPEPPPFPAPAPAPPMDVLLTGTVFFDLIFTGFPQPPTPGREVWTTGMGSAPGGIANLAVACARLGLRTGLAAGFGDDLYGDWMWQVLRDQEHVDLSYSRRFHAWHTPVTVSMALAEDRSMVTHGHPAPEPVAGLITTPPPTGAVLVDLGDPELRAAGWWHRAREAGALVFADAGWDPEEEWDPQILADLTRCDVFTPNAEEAMGYTRTSTPEDAVEALAEHVPLAVVTCGSGGALAVDRSTGKRVRVPALRTNLVDPTGAGDVFAAALVLGTLRHWPVEQRLRFAVLCASLAVQEFGGSLAAPGWGDIADWWRQVRAQAATDPDAASTVRDYAFVGNLLTGMVTRRVRRAEGTIARISDAGLAAVTPPEPPTQEEGQL